MAKNAQAELEALRMAVIKKFGEGAMHKASESAPVNRLPFLQPNLNRATNGGVGFGRFAAFSGDPGSGKSRIAFELIAQAQQLPASAERVLLPRIAYHTALSNDTSLGDIHRARHEAEAGLLSDQVDWFRREFPDGCDGLYYNAEMQFDPIWAAKIGVDIDRLEIMESVTIEEICEIMGGFYPHIPLHVVDSTSNASSLLEQKQEVGKSAGYAVDARQWKSSLRGSMTSWDRERNMGIMIHQMSTNMKTGGQQMQSTQYMNFISRMTILFRHARFLYKKDGVLTEAKADGADKASMSGQVEADGREIIARVTKSTTCRPFMNAGLQWDYDRSNFVVMHELFSAGVYGGIIVGGGPGGWWRVAGEDKNIGQGAKAVYARLADDEELRARINNDLMDSTADGL